MPAHPCRDEVGYGRGWEAQPEGKFQQPASKQGLLMRLRNRDLRSTNSQNAPPACLAGCCCLQLSSVSEFLCEHYFWKACTGGERAAGQLWEKPSGTIKSLSPTESLPPICRRCDGNGRALKINFACRVPENLLKMQTPLHSVTPDLSLLI